MRIGSLCSGYGGLERGVQSVLGGTVAWHVEYDDAPSRILAHHWPGVPNHGDVNLTDWHTVEPIDVLTAGYPCQPFSHAGKRKGTDDPRHLWPGVARAVSVLRPRLVVLENVRGHVSLGFDAVLGDLAGLGYDATWGVVRASDAGAPHGRARLFIAATDARGQRHGRGQERGRLGRVDGPDAGQARQRQRPRQEPGDRDAAAPADTEHDGQHAAPFGGGSGSSQDAGRLLQPEGCAAPTDTDFGGLEGLRRLDTLRRDPDGRGSEDIAWGEYEPAVRRWEALTRPAPAPTEPGRNGPRLSPRFVEWLMGLPAGWVTDPAIGLTRNQQLKALGNGVVPQQAALALSLLLPLTQEAAA